MKQVNVPLTGLLLFAGPLVAQPAVTAVVNAVSYDSAVPRGGLVSIFGAGLARSTVSAASLPLPTRLEDTVVRVGDLELEAPLYFVSPTQINAPVLALCDLYDYKVRSTSFLPLRSTRCSRLRSSANEYRWWLPLLRAAAGPSC